jgi:hypothetical protein
LEAGGRTLGGLERDSEGVSEGAFETREYAFDGVLETVERSPSSGRDFRETCDFALGDMGRSEGAALEPDLGDMGFGKISYAIHAQLRNSGAYHLIRSHGRSAVSIASL